MKAQSVQRGLFFNYLYKYRWVTLDLLLLGDTKKSSINTTHFPLPPHIPNHYKFNSKGLKNNVDLYYHILKGYFRSLHIRSSENILNFFHSSFCPKTWKISLSVSNSISASLSSSDPVPMSIAPSFSFSQSRRSSSSYSGNIPPTWEQILVNKAQSRILVNKVLYFLMNICISIPFWRLSEALILSKI